MKKRRALIFTLLVLLLVVGIPTGLSARVILPLCLSQRELAASQALYRSSVLPGFSV